MEKLKVLFLCANPTDKARLDLDREIREIQEKMYAADLRDKVELIVPPAVRARDLVQRLSEVKPHVVHFSGHGSSKREIFLQDDCGKAYPVPENVLNRLFTVMKDDIRLVVLNACSSGPQAKTISRTVDATIGMDAKVGDQAAIVFSAAFYRGIAFGKSVQRAFDEAVLEIMLQNIPEENTPQLFARSDVRPDKLYLLNDSRPSPRPPATIRQDAPRNQAGPSLARLHPKAGVRHGNRTAHRGLDRPPLRQDGIRPILRGVFGAKALQMDVSSPSALSQPRHGRKRLFQRPS